MGEFRDFAALVGSQRGDDRQRRGLVQRHPATDLGLGPCRELSADAALVEVPQMRYQISDRFAEADRGVAKGELRNVAQQPHTRLLVVALHRCAPYIPNRLCGGVVQWSVFVGGGWRTLPPRARLAAAAART